MHELGPPDRHHLNAAIGWLELGNGSEARFEWQKIAEVHREHPEALEICWRICAAEKNWLGAVEAASKLVQAASNNPAGWIDLSFALHELKRTQEAWDHLLPVATKFPNVSVIPYNLACYACQLGRLDTAKEKLGLAIKLKSKEEIKRMGLNDPDLKPLWPWINEL